MAKRSLKKKQSEPFTIEQENGEEKDYYLRDMDGEQRDAFVDFISKKVQRGPDGKPLSSPMKDDVGVSILLLSKTLFLASSNKPVPAETLKKWPHKLLEELAEEASELCALTEEAEEVEGNA